MPYLRRQDDKPMLYKKTQKLEFLLVESDKNTLASTSSLLREVVFYNT